ARHRALPDADLVWQLWQLIRRQHCEKVVEDTVAGLLAGPVLPPALNPALVERLPEAPGAYVLHGDANRPLVVGAAGNLKLHVLNYFRIDRATPKALEYSHRVTNITWHATRGRLGAKLHAAVLDGKAACPACPVDQRISPCLDRIGRKRQLLRVFAAIRPLVVPVWPHRGPVGIRERSDVHVVDRWQFLGTAQSEHELHALLESAPHGFDRRLYLL